MTVAAARFAGLDDDSIRDGLLSFAGVSRRQEVKGVTAAGVTIIDDFGHHPTAIRQTAESLRRRHLRNGARLWAVFEPRSNTTRRKVFQHDLVGALGIADGAVIATIPIQKRFPPTTGSMSTASSPTSASSAASRVFPSPLRTPSSTASARSSAPVTSS